MPVHSAGPRLYRSIKFQHLAKHTGGSRASNVSLNLTPFVDMMTILVTFLLMVFSAEGAILANAKNLKLPVANQQTALVKAPLVLVSRDYISIQVPAEKGSVPEIDEVVQVKTIMDNPPPTKIIDALREKLKPAAEAISMAIEAHGTKNSGYSKDQIAACENEKAGKPLPVKGGITIVCPDGLAIVQADSETDARLINMVVTTMQISGFDKIVFAVKFSTSGGTK